ncbi:MAG: hypothetical protein ACKOE8_01305 [Opitutaceae bacterium]
MKTGLRQRLRRIGGFALALTVGHLSPAAETIPGGLRGAFIINEDNSHFFGSRPPEAMTLAGLHAFIDQYAGTKVTHLFLSPNSMRASFRSRTRDAIWDPVDGREPDGLWPRNARRLHEAGLDAYAVWIARARERGISPWLSMRMNDVHNADTPGSYMHSDFWRTHPRLRRVPDGAGQPWTNHALNYIHEEVRTHQMAFVRELLERYDPEGLELDWMRFGHHLTPGREKEEAPVLTAFVREVRELTRVWSARRGHPILLGVRAPAHPDAATGLGMDAALWAREGLVDLIVPAPFWSSSDFDIPVELWRERMGPSAKRVAVLPALEHNARAWIRGVTVANDLASAYGFAASALHRGADGIYLFNWMDSQTRPVDAADYARLLRTGFSPAAVAAEPRRHPVTFRDTVPRGFPDGTQLPIRLPEKGTIRLHLGPGTASGGSAHAVIGLAAKAGDTGRLRVTLNGRELAPAGEVSDRRLIAGAASAPRFACPPVSVRAGENTLEFSVPAGTDPIEIVWVEIRVEPR